MEYGLQLYSVRDITGEDMDTALKEVAAMGYSFVEFAGFQGHTSDEIKAMLTKYGLGVSGTHTGVGALQDDVIDETIRYHKAIGCDNIIIPSADLSTKEAVEAFISLVKKVEPKLNEAGIRLHYHNHDREFKPNEDGIIPEYYLLENSNISLQVDTYWAFNAGIDNVKFIEEHKDRISVIHLKDGVKGGKGCSLGLGEARAAEVRKKAIELGYIIVVESESLDPNGIEEVRRCINFLKAEDAKD